jgi:hypothetical protein
LTEDGSCYNNHYANLVKNGIQEGTKKKSSIIWCKRPISKERDNQPSR